MKKFAKAPVCNDASNEPTNDDLFARLETVRYGCLFTHEGDMEYTGRGNTGHRGLKARVLP